MSTNENKVLVRRNFEEVINKKNLLASDDYLAPEFIDHSAPPGTPPGPKAAKRGLSFLLAVCRFGWCWTSSVGSTPSTLPSQRGKTLWDWIQVLLNPLILAAVGFWLNQLLKSKQQRSTEQRAEIERKAAEQHAQSESEIAADNQREAALQGYIDHMSELLLHEHLRTSAPQDEVSKIARVRTLTVLSRLDAIRKSSVLQFLYESGLIHKDKSIIHLSGAALIQALLSGADLREANLSGANLRAANLRAANLSGADLREADLGNADLSEAFLGEADLSEASLRAANLREAFLRAASLSGANLKEAVLIQALLREANLTGANLTGAGLGGADLSRANLRAVNLSNANLSEAVLVEADLSGVNLSRANLTGANLTGANLTRTEPSGTDLSRAKLVNALVTPEQLNEAKSLKDTTMLL